MFVPWEKAQGRRMPRYHSASFLPRGRNLVGCQTTPLRITVASGKTYCVLPNVQPTACGRNFLGFTHRLTPYDGSLKNEHRDTCFRSSAFRYLIVSKLLRFVKSFLKKGWIETKRT